MRLRYGLWFVFLAFLFLPQTLPGQTLTIPVSNPHWFFSPYNWYMPGIVHVEGGGVGVLGSGGGTETVTNQPGAYFTVSLAGSTQVVLDLDTLGIPAGGNATSLVVQWRIDGTLYPAHTVSLFDTQLVLATGLSTAPHTVQFWLVSSDYHQNRWSKKTTLLSGFFGPAQSLRITGLTLDAGATLSAPTGLQPKRILFFGDSITDGDKMTPADDAGQAFPVVCARLLHAEYGVVANAGQGWACNIAPTTGVPTFADAFSLYYEGTPRFPVVSHLQDPDYVIVNMGTNDSIFETDPTVVTAKALAWMQQIRIFLPFSQIFLVVPFGGFEAPALQSAYTQYILANPTDTKMGLLNLGPTAQTGLTAQVPGGTAQSFDGIHPNPATQQALGYQLTAAIQTALGHNDFNGDGKSDLILQNSATNQISNMYQNNIVEIGGALVTTVLDSNYQCVGSADFNGDGKPDYIFQNRLTGQIAIWYMNGPAVVSGNMVAQTPPSGFKVVGTGDFNGDGIPDIVLQNQTTNQILIWFMNGFTLLGTSTVSVIPQAGYQVVGAGDFNRDGQTDLLFQNSTSGVLVVWYMKGVQFLGGDALTGVPSPGYQVKAIADFDGDGRPDLVLANANGAVQIWHLDGPRVYLAQWLSIQLGASYSIVGPR